MRDQILVLGFDPSYAALIASRLRAEKIYCKILPGDTPVERLVAEEALGLVLAGGISGSEPLALDGQLLRTGMPVLALGDTAVAVAGLLGGQAGEARTINDVDTLTFLPSRITEDLGESERMFATVRPLGVSDDLEPLAELDGEVLGVMHKTLDIFALQCQLEQNDPDIMSLLLQFCLGVCGATRWWGEDAFISKARADIQAAVPEGNALCVMSGGLDSGVCALLAHRALGSRLQCVFVDTGLLREGEVDEFSAYYQNAGLNLRIIQAEERFLQALKGVRKQEEKRARVMDTLQSVLDETVGSMNFDLLIRSTSGSSLLSDTRDAQRHPHVNTDKPVLAPLAELFKEEIRAVGEALGMPSELTRMQSFPWTGLALRVVGECTKEKLDLLRRADALFGEEIRESGLAKRFWKYFAMLYEAPYQNREKAPVIALRAVTASHQGGDVRALPARLPWDLLERYTARMLSDYPGIAKIVYDLTPGDTLQQSEWQ
ncbi:MAG: hypothetical protein GX623_04425 [Clostridiales bacterium]|nr:hypothetical protein [Clostridiales bacterium]